MAEPPPLASARALVDYAKTLDCIHCGLCLHTCPTYRLTGSEASSPRGRIHLMRAVGEGRLAPTAAYAGELDFCLLCRHCESVCPAGVHFGAMMEHARGRVAEELPRSLVARLARWTGFRVVLPHRLALRVAGTLLSVARATGLVRLLGRLGENVPPVPRLPARRLLPAVTRATAGRRGGVVLLQGCVMPELFARVNRATARSLAALGYDAHAPGALVCCGSLHAHNGDLDGARSLARRMVEVCEPLRDGAGAPLPVVVNGAGCGAHMKECWQLFEDAPEWRARARAFAACVVDYAEFVAPRLADAALAPPGPDELPRPVTWDDPCHLCHGQGIRAEPRAILARLFGGDLVPLPNSEGCCGSAGLYALLRPDDARAVFEGKRADLAASAARTLVTANPGCQLQWETGLARAGDRVRVVHLAELVDRALTGNTEPEQSIPEAYEGAARSAAQRNTVP